MRKPAAIILLFFFLYQMTCNFWIIVSFYANQEYIVKNECINRFDKLPVCYGKCVLIKQLKNTDRQDQKLPNVIEKEAQPYLCQVDYPTHFILPAYWHP